MLAPEIPAVPASVPLKGVMTGEGEFAEKARRRKEDSKRAINKHKSKQNENERDVQDLCQHGG